MGEMSMNKAIHGAFRRDLDRFVAALSSFPPGDTAVGVTDGANPDEMAAIKGYVVGPVLAIVGGIFGRGYRKNIAPLWKS